MNVEERLARMRGLAALIEHIGLAGSSGVNVDSFWDGLYHTALALRADIDAVLAVLPASTQALTTTADEARPADV